MDRTEFLKLCQLASVADDKPMVLSGEIKYYPYGYQMTFEKGNPQHTAILHDLHANSVTYADLRKVDKAD